MGNGRLEIENDERHPRIAVRRVSFDWAATPLHWIPGDPVGTHLINSFNILLPAGEKWFIQCVKDALPEITDARLRAEIRGFIGQESVHSRTHQGVIDQLLERHGIDSREITGHIHRGNAERPGRRAAMPPRRARRMLLLELAAVAALEHYTAVLGEWIMDNRALERAGADPTMLDLLRWHAAEEIEHRSVVFDVFREIGGRYPTRAAGWALSTIFFYWTMFRGGKFLLDQDRTAPKMGAFRYLLAYRRSVRRGCFPALFRLALAQTPIYLSRAHHPSKICSTQRAVDYLRVSPAARAAGYGEQ